MNTPKLNNTGRIYKDPDLNNYSVMPNQFLQDEKLSWKAKGILAYILSLPNDWKIYKSEIVKHSPGGKDGFNSGWKELEKEGYIDAERVQDQGGKMSGWRYEVRGKIRKSMPLDRIEGIMRAEKPTAEKPSIGKSDNNVPPEAAKAEEGAGKPTAENPPLLNTNNNIKEINKENISLLVIEAFNKITGKQASMTKPRETMIMARVNDGYGLEQFKAVITWKHKEWKNDPEMKKYIRLETLMRPSHFQVYLEEAREDYIKNAKKPQRPATPNSPENEYGN